ncbi:hypothetical protein CR513_30797, partial [Mucuna pruriens]
MEILKRFGMENSHVVQNPIISRFKISTDENGVKVDGTFYMQIVGSMIYLTATRLDIMFAVSMISRCMSQPTKNFISWQPRGFYAIYKAQLALGFFIERDGIMRYLLSQTVIMLVHWSRKNTFDYGFTLSSGAVAWSSHKQEIVTMSTTKAEFVAVVACSCQAVWMKKILKKIGYEGNESTIIFCDNSLTIKLSKNPVMHGRSKHIDVFGQGRNCVADALHDTRTGG